MNAWNNFMIYFPLHIKGLICGILQDKNIGLLSFILKGIKKRIALDFDYFTSSNLLLKSSGCKYIWAVKKRVISKNGILCIDRFIPYGAKDKWVSVCQWTRMHVEKSCLWEMQNRVKQFFCQISVRFSRAKTGL